MSFLRDFVDEGPVGKRRPQLSKADKAGTKYDDGEDEDFEDPAEIEEAELEKKVRGPVAVLEI
jgi:hypothetical protein